MCLTDRCNLRCAYCMPVEGLPWLAKPTLLTDDEVRRLITIAVTQLGVRDVRFTGGEPLLRTGLEDIIAATSALGVAVSLTTNGVGLADRAVRLREAGLQRVNVSLDTLRPDRFLAIAHRERLESSRRPGSGSRGGLASGQDQRRVVTRRQRRRGSRPAVVLPCSELSAAVHRTDAAGPHALLGPRTDGDRGGDPGPASRALGAHPRAADQQNAGADLAHRRRSPPRRGDRIGHPAVLRIVQPHAADR